MNSATAKYKHWCGIQLSKDSPIQKPAKMQISSNKTRPTVFSANTKLYQQWKSSPPVHSGAEFVEWNENFVLHMQMEAASPKRDRKTVYCFQKLLQKCTKQKTQTMSEQKSSQRKISFSVQLVISFSNFMTLLCF